MDKRKKTAVHGTPLTPAAHFAELSGRSFCVSFADPRDSERAIEFVGRDGMLLLDNGAFSIWKSTKGGAIDVAAYCSWASEIMARCPQAFGVFPDVIEGTETENLDLLHAVLDSGSLDPSRSYVVWHLNESLELLAYYADRFPRIAFGSALEFDVQTCRSAFHERATEALAVVRAGAADASVHMMRGLGNLDALDFDSADSVNVARNHSRYRHEGAGWIRRFAERIEAKIVGCVPPSAPSGATLAEAA